MAAFNAKASTLYVHDVPVHDIANSLTMDRSWETSDSSVFGHTARTSTLGLMVVTVSASGYIDFDEEHASLEALGTGDTDAVVSISPTATEGDDAQMHTAGIANFTPLSATLGETAAFDVSLEGRSTVAPIAGTCILAETAISGSANGTAYQIGAVASGETMYSHLHVIATTGSPTLDVVIASDSAEAFDQTPETQITHTQATARTAERSTVAGAITDDWWRAQYTFGGTGTITAAVFIGIL